MINAYDDIPDTVLKVPIMCNPGIKEGVIDKKSKFTRVWPTNESYLNTLRAKNALVGVSIDPFTAHECGKSRYMAITWLDACLAARVPDKAGSLF